MVCENCDPKLFKPGGLVKVTKDLIRCAVYGDRIMNTVDMAEEIRNASQERWDKYFHTICVAVASKSPCLSRHIGAILVRDHSIVATGYNGPARGVPHCGHERFMKDSIISNEFKDILMLDNIKRRIANECPRRILGYESGTHLELCPAQHAEANCITNAARLGVSVLDTILYMNCVIPCKNCFGKLINAGVAEIVVDDATPYDKHTQFIIDNSSILIREFKDV